jgi:signal transduction histidine kinase
MSKPPFTLELASIDSLGVGYIVTNVDHEVSVINHAARELLAATGVTKTLEEVVERLPKRLELLDHVKYCSVEHKSCSFREVQLGDRKVRVFLSPIFDGWELRGNVLTLEDITDKVAQERARDEFLTYLVHELRTPLAAIRGNADLIKVFSKDNNENVRGALEDINIGSKYLLQMVNQFLDMSRLEEGRIEYKFEQFNATDLIAETVASLDVLARERSLSLEFKPPKSSVAQVVADMGRAKQVLTNLIGNALKFTEKGGVTVTIATKKDMLEVSVADTGPGIPPESKANLFQKYFQASNNILKHDGSKSTGLGLYVTKLMADGMGGNIELRASELGKGSTFTFSLTLATPERLKYLVKQRADAKQGVQHAPAPSFEHTSQPT